MKDSSECRAGGGKGPGLSAGALPGLPGLQWGGVFSSRMLAAARAICGQDWEILSSPLPARQLPGPALPGLQPQQGPDRLRPAQGPRWPRGADPAVPSYLFPRPEGKRTSRDFFPIFNLCFYTGVFPYLVG